VGLQIIASVSAVLAIWAWEVAQTALVMGAYMSRKVCFL